MTYRELLGKLKTLPDSELDKDVLVMVKNWDIITVQTFENTVDIDVLGAPEQFMLIE